MKPLPFLLLCLSLFGLLGCQPDQTKSMGIMSHATVAGTEIPVYDLSLLPDSAERIPLSEVFHQVDIVPLETSKECYIKNAMPGYTGHSYLIATQDASLGPVRVLEFGLDGKFIHEIGRGGKGPGEHQGYMAMNMRFYPKDSTLFIPFFGAVLSTDNQLFDREGHYLSYIQNPVEMTDRMERFNDTLWMTPGSITQIPEMHRDSVMLVLYNQHGTIFKTFQRQKYPRQVLSGYFQHGWGPSMLQVGTDWHFYLPGNDTLFRITLEKLEPIGVFHLGPKGESYNEPVDVNKVTGKYSIRILTETNRHLLVSKSTITKADIREYQPGRWGGMYDTDQSYIIIEKNTGKARHVKFTDDLTGIIPERTLNYNYAYPENMLSIHVPQALDLIEWLRKPQIADPSPQVRERQEFLRKNLTEMSNPVVFHYIFKEDF